MATESILAQAIAEQAIPMIGAHSDFDPLLDRIGDAPFVLLGEATHGSHEFYRIRAELTKRLIREKGFAAVAAEADWPDAYRVNQYIRGVGRDLDAADALAEFQRFPQWMWRNADILDLVGWLRSHNDQISDPARRVGFYGLDLYSLHSSMAAVLAYLDARDPEAARRARDRYACFDVFGEDPQHYSQAVALGLAPDCEQEVLTQLVDLLRHRGELLRRDGLLAEDAQFEAEQNARVVAHAEEYYRSMYVGGVSTWNLRDTHMADTLDALAAHFRRLGRSAKIRASQPSNPRESRPARVGCKVSRGRDLTWRMSDAPACCCGDWVAGLARDHAGRLAAVARREGVGASDALDVVQDAFHTLLARPDVASLRTRPDEAARLLAVIVRNAARNLRRRHHNARPHVDVATSALATAEPRPDDALAQAITATQLVGCMAQLGDVHRQIVRLRVLEELSGEEAAQALGLTTNHVAVLLHRARKELERCMLSA